MDLVVFEENKPQVLAALHEGELDYIEAASEHFETDFFRYIGAKNILAKAAQTYPTPRTKHDVPLWLYIASDLSMRLHGVHSYNAYPMVVRTGGMLNAFASSGNRKTTHPDTGELTLSCQGFNDKNHYDRETPCDQDYLRKIARDSDADAVMRWFGHDVAKIFRTHRAYDREGIFIGDGSYLFLPDNENYEGAAQLLFDEHGHPVDKKALGKMTEEQKLRCEWKRCYKMVTLLHTNRTLDFFLLVAVKVVPGNANECPILYDLVEQFTEAVGPGVLKKLVLDRGFLDGAGIARCKEVHGIDVLIPVRTNMDIYSDAMALFDRSDVEWVECQRPDTAQQQKPTPRLRPAAIRKRERKRQETLAQLRQQRPPDPPEKILVKKEAAAIGGFTSWSSCTVPLCVIANREVYADGHEDQWLLLSTQPHHDPAAAANDYHLRTTVEERYRHLKCFSDLAAFTSRAFSLVVNQVVFTMLAYDLLQIYLLRQHRKELNRKTPQTIRRQLLPADNHIVVYWNGYYGLFEHNEYTELIALELSDEARRKVGLRCRRIRRELAVAIRNPRPPWHPYPSP